MTLQNYLRVAIYSMCHYNNDAGKCTAPIRVAENNIARPASKNLEIYQLHSQNGTTDAKIPLFWKTNIS